MDCFLAQEYLFRSNIFSGQDETVAVQELLQAGGCGRTRPSTASPCPGRHRYISLPVAHFNQGSSFFHSLMMVFTGVFGFECSLKSVLLCAESRHIRHIGEFLCQKKWGFWFFFCCFFYKLLNILEHVEIFHENFMDLSACMLHLKHLENPYMKILIDIVYI